MQYPRRFSALQGYPFPRLRALLRDVPATGDALRLSIGEPKHAFPDWVTAAIDANAQLYNAYPLNNGMPEWHDAVIGYLKTRFNADADADMLTPLNGTREGLYMIAPALFPEEKNGRTPKVLVPNPFYQVYMIGAKTLGLDVEFVNATAQNGHLPDYAALSPDVLNDTAALFLCSPSNPQGAIADDDYLRKIIALAEEYDFLVIADECYAELYYGDAPNSAFKIAQDMGADLNRIVAFHSLSKRSNLPGLRSGFAVSGDKTMAKFRELRSYAGAPVPGPTQMVSAKLWRDQDHVAENRAQYAEKFDDARAIFGEALVPKGGFFLWLPVEDDEAATSEIWQHHAIEILPGSYLGAQTPTGNPGENYIRVALVHEREKTKDALNKISNWVRN